MKLVSRRHYDAPPDDVPLLCPVRDEIVLVPHFLAHHRKLGVENFIFIDNGSNDGTLEYLTAQDDCVVYLTRESYRLSNYAANWINQLLSELCQNRWAAYLDCDEHLVYPGCEHVRLGDYCRELSGRGFDSTFALLLDLYPEGDFRRLRITDQMPLSETLNCFDIDYVVRRYPLKPWMRGTNLPVKLEILGGPRCRLVSSLEKEAGRTWIDYMAMGQVDRFVRYVPQSCMHLLARHWPLGMPAMHKQPLNRIRDGFRYHDSHNVTNRRISTEMLALLHFKFCDEVNAKLDADFIYQNHYRRGLERFKIKRAIEGWPSASLVYEGTRRYRRSDDLLEVGLIGPAASRVWSDAAAGDFRTREVAGPRSISPSLP